MFKDRWKGARWSWGAVSSSRSLSIGSMTRDLIRQRVEAEMKITPLRVALTHLSSRTDSLEGAYEVINEK